MNVAMVRNRSRNGVIYPFGQPCPEVYGRRTVQRTMDALREGGHSVVAMEGDKTLLSALEAFLPRTADGLPRGMAFNMAYGIQGQARYTHVPAMLEMAGVPYTGAGPLGHAVSLDKAVAKILMRDAGVPTPNSAVMNAENQNDSGLRYPLVAKPRHESTSFGLRLVETRAQLSEAVEAICDAYCQDALVEEYIEGREAAVALLGNQPPEALPLVEYDFGGRSLKTVTCDDKFHKQQDEPEKICPAPIEENLAQRIRAMALAAFRACHCLDYARVDIRIDSAGNPFVLEINSMASLGAGGSFVRAAEAAGYSFSGLACRILDLAHLRYFGTPAPRDTDDSAFSSLGQET